MSKSAVMPSLLFVVVGVLLPSFSYAHVSIGGSGSFMHGFAHPLSGLDHACAMLAVGLWAAQMGGRFMWVVSLAFVGLMALGSILPMLDISLPYVEQGIVLSVLLLGVLIAASIRLPLWLGSSMVGLFALWHGHAHGTGIPTLGYSMAYALGFMLATASLHIVGIVFGLGMQRLTRESAVRAAGASIALCGVYLAVT